MEPTNKRAKKNNEGTTAFYIAPPVIMAALFADYYFFEMITLSGVVVFPFVLLFGLNISTASNFSKKHYFKILS